MEVKPRFYFRIEIPPIKQSRPLSNFVTVDSSIIMCYVYMFLEVHFSQASGGIL
jgi:hypothetical protein